eukprot:2682635-Rhodomonas_salina.2
MCIRDSIKVASAPPSQHNCRIYRAQDRIDRAQYRVYRAQYRGYRAQCRATEIILVQLAYGTGRCAARSWLLALCAARD